MILTSSSLQTNFLNLQPNQHGNNIQQAFAQSIDDIRQIHSYTIFGLQNIILQTNVTMVNGSIGVQNASPNMQLPSNAEINIGSNSKFQNSASAVAGDSVLISNGDTIQNVYYNQLQNSGTVLGTQNTPLQLPLIQQLPSFPHSTPGTTSINVPASSSSTLSPGQYGAISIGDYGILHMTGGIYNVTSITTGKSAQLLFDSPSQVVVQNQMTWKKGSFVGPSASSIHSHDIVIFVGGNTDINQNTTDTSFGKNAIVKANIYAPTGSITMERGTIASGAFMAKTVIINQDSVISRDSAFGPVIPGQLTVIKKIVNTGGGNLTLSGVTLKINGTTVTNGTANTLPPGNYKISENSIPSYTSNISGDCASDGTITLNPGAVKTCVITNTFAQSLFFENFDNPLSGWILYGAFTACCGAPALDQVTTAFGFPSPSLPNWGEVHAIANGGQCIPNDFVDFQKPFTVNTPGNYNVSATIGAALCDVCVVDGRVDVDHSSVLQQGGGTISGGSPSTIAFKSAVINIPSAGTHVMDLRMDSSIMCSGNFASYFDNVSVQPTTSSVTGTPVGGPYFNVTIDQQSANVTRPNSVTVPLDVNWYQGWSAQPVSILFANLTNTNISTTVTSIQNTTNYQEFSVTFNVQNTVATGNYTIPITVWQTGTDDAIATSFTLHVK